MISHLQRPTPINQCYIQRLYCLIVRKTMDLLSDVLARVKPQSGVSAQLLTGGDWAMAFTGYDGIKFTAIQRGHCWLQVDGDEATYRLGPGDGYLLTDGRPYRLASDLALPPADAQQVFADAENGCARYNDRDELSAIGGRFSFDPSQADLLIEQLPCVIHIPATSRHAATLPWLLEQLAGELRGAEAGANLMADHLAHMLLLHALRHYLQDIGPVVPGWLNGLTDPRIGSALTRLHRHPAHPWTVAELAGASGMSRTVFSQRFKTLIGRPPMDYLLHWRMRLAAESLRMGHDSVASIGYALGYESDSAFNHAFKRVMGVSPRGFRVRCPE